MDGNIRSFAVNGYGFFTGLARFIDGELEDLFCEFVLGSQHVAQFGCCNGAEAALQPSGLPSWQLSGDFVEQPFRGPYQGELGNLGIDLFHCFDQ